MGRKKIHAEELVMVSRRLPISLWYRFKHFCDYYIPRTSDTAMLEAAISEFLDRHEPKTKKEGKA